MKYSLRSLFIVVTLVAVLLGGTMGRIKYLRRMAAFHKEQAARIAKELGLEIDPEHEEFVLIVVPNSNTHDARDKMRRHAHLAAEYETASYRPWMLVNDWPLP